MKPLFFYLVGSSTKPLSNYYGLDRGAALDRFYIDHFIKTNESLIHGSVLELLDDGYTKRFGKEKVAHSDILDIDLENKKATITGDLRRMHQIADNTYDCIILTQVLQFIDELETALRECRRILKPGGSILITVPAMSRIDCVSGTEGDFWRFTPAGLRHLLSKVFTNIEVEGLGNARAGLWYWAGAAQEEIDMKALKVNDPNFPVSVTAVVKK